MKTESGEKGRKEGNKAEKEKKGREVGLDGEKENDSGFICYRMHCFYRC